MNDRSVHDKLRRDLDLRLLRVLHVLLDEASVSRTAILLGQSQPAVSASLRRLRELTGDPLLVRSGSHLVPTEHGLALKDTVARILADVDSLLDRDAGFDPLTSQRHIRIVASNCLGPFLLPPLVERLRAEAPHVELELSPRPGPDRLPQMLESGEIDLVLANWPDPAPSLRFAPLLECDMACLVPDGHPAAAAGSLSLDAYLSLDHLSPTPPSSAPWSPVDGRLEQISRARRIALSLPEYALIPYVLARTELVFTTARPLAEHFAAMMPFTVVEAPPELGRMSFYMLWHERAHQTAFARWLRRTVRSVAADLERPGVPADTAASGRFIRAA